MANAIVKIKMMPSSPEVNIEEIQKKVKEILEEEKVDGEKFEVEPIAFGLNALFVTFFWPEEKELEFLEESLKKVENINSVEVVDMRREIG